MRVKNVFIVVFVILTIILGCVCSYLFISLQNTKLEMNNLNENYEKKLSNLNEEKIETEKQKTLEIVAFDSNKSKANSNYEYKLSSRSSRGIVAGLSNDGTTVSVYFNNETKKLFPNINESFLSQENKITEFADKVVDIQVESIAQYEEDSALIFLLKNKTVQYLTLKDMCVNGNFKPKTITNLSNIVRIDGASGTVKQSEGVEIPIAIDNEGYFYDLSEYIK